MRMPREHFGTETSRLPERIDTKTLTFSVENKEITITGKCGKAYVTSLKDWLLLATRIDAAVVDKYPGRLTYLRQVCEVAMRIFDEPGQLTTEQYAELTSLIVKARSDFKKDRNTENKSETATKPHGQYRAQITNIISKMLDNPGLHVIYSTTECFEALDYLINEAQADAVKNAEFEITTEQAVNKLRQELARDQVLRYTYQSNIAMAFVDVIKRFTEKFGQKRVLGLVSNPVKLKQIANRAADDFLELLVGDLRFEDSEPAQCNQSFEESPDDCLHCGHSKSAHTFYPETVQTSDYAICGIENCDCRRYYPASGMSKGDASKNEPKTENWQKVELRIPFPFTVDGVTAFQDVSVRSFSPDFYPKDESNEIPDVTQFGKQEGLCANCNLLLIPGLEIERRNGKMVHRYCATAKILHDHNPEIFTLGLIKFSTNDPKPEIQSKDDQPTGFGLFWGTDENQPKDESTKTAEATQFELQKGLCADCGEFIREKAVEVRGGKLLHFHCAMKKVPEYFKFRALPEIQQPKPQTYRCVFCNRECKEGMVAAIGIVGKCSCFTDK